MSRLVLICQYHSKLDFPAVNYQQQEKKNALHRKRWRQIGTAAKDLEGLQSYEGIRIVVSGLPTGWKACMGDDMEKSIFRSFLIALSSSFAPQDEGMSPLGP